MPDLIATWLRDGKMRWNGNDLEVAPWTGPTIPDGYEIAFYVAKDKNGNPQPAGVYDRSFLVEVTEKCKKKLNNWGFHAVSQ